MTAHELRQLLNNRYGIDKTWPSHMEVDPETYADVCQKVFDNHTSGVLLEDGKKVIEISLGVNNGILFKNVELVLIPTVPQNFLSMEELKTLYKLLSHEYISYENPDAIALVRKIRTLIGE